MILCTQATLHYIQKIYLVLHHAMQYLLINDHLLENYFWGYFFGLAFSKKVLGSTKKLVQNQLNASLQLCGTFNFFLKLLDLILKLIILLVATAVLLQSNIYYKKI